MAKYLVKIIYVLENNVNRHRLKKKDLPTKSLLRFYNGDTLNIEFVVYKNYYKKYEGIYHADYLDLTNYRIYVTIYRRDKSIILLELDSDNNGINTIDPLKGHFEINYPNNNLPNGDHLFKLYIKKHNESEQSTIYKGFISILK